MRTKTIALMFSDCRDCIFATLYDPDDVGISFGPTLYCLNAGWENPDLADKRTDFDPDRTKSLREDKHWKYPIPDDCPLPDGCKIKQ